MANSYVNYTGDGATSVYAVPFPYLSQSHVSVYVNGVSAPFTWNTSSLINLGSAPASGAVVAVRRATPTGQLAQFNDGSTLVDDDLNVAALQPIYIAQEAVDATAFTVRSPLTDVPLSPAPPAAQRKGGIPVFDPTTGDLRLSSKTVGQLETYLEDAQALSELVVGQASGDHFLTRATLKTSLVSAAAAALGNVVLFENGYIANAYYNPSSTAAPDALGVSVIQPPDAPAAGRWLLTPNLYGRPTLTPRDFGAVVDGVTDDYVAAQAWLTAVCAGKCIGALNPGDMAISQGITASGRDWAIISGTAGRILAIGTMTDIVKIGPTTALDSSFIIKGLRVASLMNLSTNTLYATNGITVQNLFGCGTIEDCRVEFVSGIGFNFINLWNTRFVSNRYVGTHTGYGLCFGQKGMYFATCDQAYIANNYVTGVANNMNPAHATGTAYGIHTVSGYNLTLIGNQCDLTGVSLRMENSFNNQILNHDSEQCTLGGVTTHNDLMQIVNCDNIEIRGGTWNWGSTSLAGFTNGLTCDMHLLDVTTSTRVVVDHVNFRGGGITSGTPYNVYVNDTSSDVEFGSHNSGTAYIAASGVRFGGQTSQITFPQVIINIPHTAFQITQAGTTSPSALAVTGYGATGEYIGSLAVAHPISGSPNDHRSQMVSVEVDRGVFNRLGESLIARFYVTYFTPTAAGNSIIQAQCREVGSGKTYDAGYSSNNFVQTTLAPGATATTLTESQVHIINTLNPATARLNYFLDRTVAASDTNTGTLNIIGARVVLQRNSWI